MSAHQDAALRTQKQHHTSENRPGPSSYWLASEIQDFDKLVAHFGTNWLAIANHMGTKTATMVKNHYLRVVERGHGVDLDLASIAKTADDKRLRGEEAGPPPRLTPASKRQFESTTGMIESPHVVSSLDDDMLPSTLQAPAMRMVSVGDRPRSETKVNPLESHRPASKNSSYAMRLKTVKLLQPNNISNKIHKPKIPMKRMIAEDCSSERQNRKNLLICLSSGVKGSFFGISNRVHPRKHVPSSTDVGHDVDGMKAEAKDSSPSSNRPGETLKDQAYTSSPSPTNTWFQPFIHAANLVKHPSYGLTSKERDRSIMPPQGVYVSNARNFQTPPHTQSINSDDVSHPSIDIDRYGDQPILPTSLAPPQAPGSNGHSLNQSSQLRKAHLGRAGLDPQARPRRQYRGYHAPGTQFRRYKGPRSGRSIGGSGNLEVRSEPAKRLEAHSHMLPVVPRHAY